MECSVLIKNNKKSDILLVSFSGYDLRVKKVSPFIFVNLFEKHFQDLDQYFFNDIHRASYHKGIEGISTTIDETVEYLKNVIRPYKRVIFVGVCSGGYAAILLGSLLNVNTVLAFIPQTHRRAIDIDEKYRDSIPYMNTTTKYVIYGDLSVKNPVDPHHISHCDRIANQLNTTVIRKDIIIFKKLKEDGELFTILYNIIYN